ncbi:hypothetical protein [Aurantiacibacter zhengii]|uniref:hypothetical protein n=1 Tax=Aurantiacibacter zhengii TaxID=2307003 RepID=UPI0018F436F3|nr:hypothetical protein [Aurantiacibacter zhengii]
MPISWIKSLIGASKFSQIESNVAATELELTADQLARLNEASAPTPGFSALLTSRNTRRMVHGGHAVSGWDDQSKAT